MPVLVDIFLIGWIPATLLLFFIFPARRAILFSVVGGLILLPGTYIRIPGLPGDYTRVSIIALSCLIGALLTNASAFRRFRFVATDYAVLVLCLAPLATSASNNLGIYDGLSVVYVQTLHFGAAYLLGRLYFGGSAGSKEILVAVAATGALLILPVLWEVRMSPRLHSIVFGEGVIRFMMFSRFGGFRPIVFFQSPLALTFVLAAATMASFWLHQSIRGSSFYGIRYLYLAGFLALTTLLSKTFGAISLMLAGVALLWAMKRTGRRWILMSAVIFMFLYPSLRVTQILPAETIISIIEPIFPEEKVQTFTYRVTQEDLYSSHTMNRPWFGWGGWGRNRTEETKAIDGLWIIMFSKYGLVGVGALLLSFAIPIFRVFRRMPRRGWSDPVNGPAAGLAMILFTYWIDCLLNGFLNPLMMIGLGSLAAWRPAVKPAAADSTTTPTKEVPTRAASAGPRFIDLKRRPPRPAEGVKR